MPTVERITTAFRSAFGMADPLNVDSEVQPYERKGYEGPPVPSASERALTQLVNKRYKDAADYRRFAERRIYEGIAYWSNNQWVEYDSRTGGLSSLVQDKNMRHYWVTDNQIEPLVRHNTARATSTKPDVWPAPLTNSQEDTAAAATARSILAHTHRRNDQDAIVREWVRAALISSTSFVKISWDATAMVDIANGTDQQGNAVGISTQPIGDVDSMVLLPIDVYPDPKARRFFDSEWVIHASIMSLSAIQEKYPDTGKYVTASHGEDGNYGASEQRLQMVSDNAMAGYTDKNRKNAALVLEMWEKPSPRYEAGRMITCAGEVLLQSSDFPYEAPEKYPYPFIPLAYESGLRSIWGTNMVSPLISLQTTINRTISHIAGRAGTDKAALLIQDGSEVSPDAYNNPHEYHKVLYKAGMAAPTWQQAPPPNAYLNALIATCKAEMETIAGVHDLAASDKAPPQLSGVALELLQNADTSKLSMFIGNIETALVQMAEWELALYRQFATQFKRLVGLDDMAVPGGANAPGAMPGITPQGTQPGMPPQPAPQPTALLEMASLKNGKCRVVVTKGSGMPKTPAAEEEQLQDVMKLVLQAFPGSAAAIEFYLNQSNVIRSDENVDRLIAGLKQLEAQTQANQPNPAAIQAMKNEQAQQALQAQLQQAQEMEAIKVDAAKQIEQFKADVQIHLATVKAQLQMQIDEANARNAILASHQDHVEELNVLQTDKATTPPVSLSLAAKAGPAATVSMEEHAGLEPDKPEDMKAMLTPKPAAPGTKPTNGATGKP